MTDEPGPDVRARDRRSVREAALGIARAERRFAADLVKATWGTLRGGPGDPRAAPVPVAARDWRFEDPGWSASSCFRLLQQSYLLSGRLVRESVDALPLDPRDRRVVGFLAQLAVDAAAPTNFLAGNPAALRTAWRTRGRSLLRGAANLATDLRTHHGLPAVVDRTGFAKGRDLAATPGRVVFRNQVMELLQYAPATETVHATPMLVSPPWVNKYYVLDLAPGRSVVEWLVEHGHTVFCLSYRNPDAALRDVGFEHYLRDGLLASLEVIGDITGCAEVNVTGACLGGLLALMLAAWQADAGTGEDGGPRVGCITLLNTLVDFRHIAELARGGISGALCDLLVTDVVERATARDGYLDGHSIDAFFRFLRANDLVWRYVASSWLMGEPPPAFDILAWNADVMNVAHRAQWYFMREIFFGNAFATGTAELAGRPLRPDRIGQDVFITAARNDHIIPWRSAYRTTALLSGDVRFLLVSGGHVAGVISPPHPKLRYWTNDQRPRPDPDAWLAGATEHRDTWWRPWRDWLAERSGPLRPPPPTGSARFPAREKAPGIYVHS